MKITLLKPRAGGPAPPQQLLRFQMRCWRVWCLSAGLVISLAVALPTPSRAAVSAADAGDTHAGPNKKTGSPASTAKTMGEQVREAIDSGIPAKKRLTLVIDGKEKKYLSFTTKPEAAPTQAALKTVDNGRATAQANAVSPQRATPVVTPQTHHQYIRAKAAALTGHDTPATADSTGPAQHDSEVHWSYAGENGPQAWGKLKPDFNVCAIGKRQSPINIEESGTLQGPAEPLQFSYQPSSGTVVNNGHTIQVDMIGDNAMTVRGSTFKLLQFHFHHPSEERVNYQGFAMVAHLVHKNAEGQLAVVAVLLEPGAANALINKVWTHMPLDTGDRVRLPTGLIDMNELLPTDQRYYQFMGSLTTPPCSEGVLWLVLKQPATASPAQIKLFSQLFPNNARPVQPINGRPVRDAQ